MHFRIPTAKRLKIAQLPRRAFGLPIDDSIFAVVVAL
jgi:hypothetical protein